MRFLAILSMFLMIIQITHAELLPANKAFQFSVQSNTQQQATLTWQIEPNYYLYQQKISVKQGNQSVKLNLPKGQNLYDENFGHSQVYLNQLSFNIDVQKNKTYTVMWQGCAKDQICYAPQQMQFKTDATGQVISPQKTLSLTTTKSNSVFLQSKVNNKDSSSLMGNTEPMLVDGQIDSVEQQDKKVKQSSLSDTSSKQVDKKELSSPATGKNLVEKSALTQGSQNHISKENTPTSALPTYQVSEKQSELSLTDESVPVLMAIDVLNHTSSTPPVPDTVLAQDQHWLEQLQQHSFAYAVLLFLGLGFLLAFTPCSLPMIPILSSLLVREHKGVKAWVIALVFVLSMASVYAMMGFIASSAGLSLQRWLQQPATVIAFAILFVIFALNLFGAFEIKLPHKWVQRLDHWQSLQQGGTLASASVMGVLSALLVGPCMTAPLAGVLLFIAQSEHQWQGAMLLFSMGFGMGIPLLLVSILGDRALPKAGQWMNQVKVFFGFIMLALAVYFIRPLIPSVMYQMVMAILGLGALAYVLRWFMWKHILLKTIYVVAVMISLSGIGYYHYQQYQRSISVVEHIVWHKVQNATELNQQFALAKGQKIIVDVYADWCVTCQPIERLFKQADVQTALHDYYAIKLDLSEYHTEHQALLDRLEVLGPPTVMFFNTDGQEVRQYRLVGNFKKSELIQRVQGL